MHARILIVGSISLTAFLVVVYSILARQFFSDLERMARMYEPRQHEQSTVVYDQFGKKFGDYSDKRRVWVDLALLPEHVIGAFLAVEDGNFYGHGGISFTSILRASYVNFRKGYRSQGASTITQQLARRLFLKPDKTLLRKIKEVFLAFFLEKHHSKNDLLEAWLNISFFGNNSWGIEVASRNYFRKPASKLTVPEAALLAGLLKAPSRLAPNKNYDKSIARQRLVLNLMRQRGYISNSYYQELLTQDVHVFSQPEWKNRKAGYFMSAIRSVLSSRFKIIDLETGGYKVYTSLKLNQHQSLRSWINREFKSNTMEVGVVVLDSDSGAVLSMQGGVDYRFSKFNRVTKMRRPIGNSLVPLVHALAFENGYKLTDSLGQQFGLNNKTSLFKTLQRQDPYGTARLVQKLGLGTIRSFLVTLGLKFELDDMQLAIGQGKASPLELAGSFMPFSSKGMIASPWMIDRIENSEGTVLFQKQLVQKKRVLSEQTAYQVSWVRRIDDPWQISSVTATDVNQLGQGWLILWSPSKVAVLWLGHDRGGAIRNTFDQVLALMNKIRKKFPLELLQGEKSWAQPEGIAFRRDRGSSNLVKLPIRM